jgi:quercetin 2,3-dioxygenase
MLHRDHLGNEGVIGPGGVQWMTAGRGIVHDEMPRLRDGHIDGLQLWVNLPAGDKMTPPRYQTFAADEIPEHETPTGALVRVIAGEAGLVRGPVAGIAAAPTYLDVRVPPHAAYIQAVGQDQNAFAYTLHGEGSFGGERDEWTDAHSPQLVVLGAGEAVVARTGHEPLRFLLIAARPLHEPIARYGPFVMNTREEILQTLDDLRNGRFTSD